MKRVLFSLLFIITVLSLLLVSCASNGKKQNLSSDTNGSTVSGSPSDTVSDSNTGTIETKDPSVERVPFDECDFYSILSMVNSVYADSYIGEYDKAAIYKNLRQMYENGEFDSFEGEDLTMAVVNEFIYETGDAYGYYFTENAFNEYMKESEGNYVGIGVTVTYLHDFPFNSIKNDPESETVEGGVMVIHIDEASMANGIVEVGDIIIRGDGKTASEIGYDELINKIRGEEGTFAEFSVIRGAKVIINDDDTFSYDLKDAHEIDLRVERHAFVQKTVYSEYLGDGLGYINITEFAQKTEEQFLDSLVTLTDMGAHDFIFDVRSNPGGTVDSVVAVLSTILDYDVKNEKRAVFSVADKDGNEDPTYISWSETVMDYYDIDPSDTVKGDFKYKNIADEYKNLAVEKRKEAENYTGTKKEEVLALAEKYERYSDFEFNIPKDSKVVVMVNSNTASAGELFTKILSDYGVSTTIGTLTFGKGSMQSMYYLSRYTPSLGVVKITANTYKSPYSDNYNGVGITPDIEVTLTSPEQKISMYLVPRNEDEQFEYAVGMFKK